MLIRCSVVVLLALLHAAPALAQTPTVGSWREEVQRLLDASGVRPGPGRAHTGVRPMGAGGKDRLARLLAARRPTLARDAATVAESEPNDGVAAADSAALGDRATGVVNPARDVDTWFVDLIAGQLFSVDVDAAQVGSALDPTLTLLAPDGRTGNCYGARRGKGRRR